MATDHPPHRPSDHLAGRMIVYVTMPDAQTAQAICETLVRERYAACANIMDGAKSVYWWRNELETSTETVCIFKTTRERYPAFQARAIELHPYEVPCIVAWPLEQGNQDFLDWIGTETATRESGI